MYKGLQTVLSSTLQVCSNSYEISDSQSLRYYDLLHWVNSITKEQSNISSSSTLDEMNYVLMTLQHHVPEVRWCQLRPDVHFALYVGPTHVVQTTLSKLEAPSLVIPQMHLKPGRGRSEVTISAMPVDGSSGTEACIAFKAERLTFSYLATLPTKLAIELIDIDKQNFPQS